MKYKVSSILMVNHLCRIVVFLWIVAALAACAPKRSLHRNYKKQKRKCSDCPSFTKHQTPATTVYARYKTA